MTAPGQLVPTTGSGYEKKHAELLLTAACISFALHLFIVYLGFHFFKDLPVFAPPRPIEFSLVILTESALAPRPQETGMLPRSRPAPKPKPMSRPRPSPVVEPLVPSIKTESKQEPVVPEKQQEQPSNLSDAYSTPQAPLAPADSGSLTNSTGAGLPVIAPIYDADYLSNPVPPYPPVAKRLKLQGTVIVRVLVNLEGKPESVHLQKSSGASILDDAAVDAVKHWSFVPARQGNMQISAWVDVPILFRLK